MPRLRSPHEGSVREMRRWMLPTRPKQAVSIAALAAMPSAATGAAERRNPAPGNSRVILSMEPHAVAVRAGFWMGLASMSPSEFELCLNRRLCEAPEDRRFICLRYAVMRRAEAVDLVQPRTHRVM